MRLQQVWALIIAFGVGCMFSYFLLSMLPSRMHYYSNVVQKKLQSAICSPYVPDTRTHGTNIGGTTTKVILTDKSSLDIPPNETPADYLYKKVKVLCWIMTQPANHGTKAYYVNKTWAPRCNHHFFISSEKDKKLDFPIVVVNETESRGNLWKKTIFAYEYIHDHFLNDYDFFIKADDDSYLILENLRLFLANVSAELPVFAGRHFKTHVKQGYMSGGASYVLSREAVKRFVRDGTRDKIKQKGVCNIHQSGGAEDIDIGRCLEAVDVKVLKSLDDQEEERFHPFNPGYHIFAVDWPKDFWMWSYTFHKIKYFMECCSDYSISFHYITPKEMLVFDYFIYHLRPFGRQRDTNDLKMLKKLLSTRKK